MVQVMNARIIERTDLGNFKKTYVIQTKHWLFRWWWNDDWFNTIRLDVKCYFSTLEEAEKNLCYFDGSTPIDKVVKEV